MATAYSVRDFCRTYGISPGLFYRLIRTGRGPKIMKLGRRTLISAEAVTEWRRRMEQDAAPCDVIGSVLD